MRLFGILLTLLISSTAFAQQGSEVMYPAAAAEQKAAAREEKVTLDAHQTMYPMAAAEKKKDADEPAQVSVAPQVETGRVWSSIEIVLTVGVLVFTLIVLWMVVFLASKAQKPWSPQSILRVFGITLIIPLAVMLVVAGYSERQIASVVGLLGVIAGYLLGNGERRGTTPDN